jgi:hypothetical protein
MNWLYIEEYSDFLIRNWDGDALPIPDGYLASHRVAIGEASASSPALAAATRFVLLQADVPCQIAIGAAPDASMSWRLLMPGQIRELAVRPGDRIAVIERQP